MAAAARSASSEEKWEAVVSALPTKRAAVFLPQPRRPHASLMLARLYCLRPRAHLPSALAAPPTTGTSTRPREATTKGRRTAPLHRRVPPILVAASTLHSPSTRGDSCTAEALTLPRPSASQAQVPTQRR
ncbi:unnamed protein product [Urochloa humidicola]